MQTTYKALWINEVSDGVFERSIAEKPLSTLPPNEVLIRVKYSALNYKDALSATGHKGITKQYPHTPGIDAAGTVVSDATHTFSPGEEVIVTSYDLGMNTLGGFSEYISVPASWVVRLPKNLSLKESMILGTAGFTAGLALHKMEIGGQTPEMGPILVTGATGGVGSMALAILNKAGYETIASTGKTTSHPFLKQLGATTIISREEVNDASDRPFLKTRWAGAIDTVGGNTLSTVLKSCGHNGNVATCGLVDKPEFSTTVYPFIIKGNNLLGIESATCNMETRQQIWHKLAGNWKIDYPKEGVIICGLDTLNSTYIDLILKGKISGRVLVEING